MTSSLRGDARVARFGGWAVTFEHEPVSRLLVELQRLAFEVLQVTPGDRVLDVGCGTAAALRDATPVGASAVAVDLTHPMLVRARQLAGSAPLHLVCADGTALPFRDGAFTAVLCTAVLRHVTEPTTVLAEMRRVLDAGSRIVVADFDVSAGSTSRTWRRRRHEPPALAAAVVDAGLRPTVVRQTPSLLGTYTIVLARSR